MRLRSALIQNFRVHERLELDLDDDRVLVIGPNESGKSTAAEAIHLALHLAHGYTGELVRDVGVGGRARVELRFEADGHACRLVKVFGEWAELDVDGETLRDAAADQRLAELLHTDGAISRGGATTRIATRWSHLWVAQRESSDAPELADDTERDRLAGHLRALGGAAVAQTDLDARVHAQLRAWAEQDFVKKGDALRQTSDVEKAREALAQADDRVAELEQDLAKLEDAMDREERSAAEEARHLAAVAGAEAELARVRQRLAEVEVLAAAHAALEAGLQSRRAGREALARHLGEIRALEQADRELAGRAARLAATRSEQEVDLTAARGAVTRREAEAREASRRARAAQLALGRLRAARELRQATARVAGLEVQAQEVEALQARQLALLAQAAGLPGVSAGDVDDLAARVAAADQARSRVEGAAARVRVVQAGRTVTLDGVALGVGEQRLLQEETEIRVGDDVILHLVPGGGASLAELREAATVAAEALDRRLGELGVASLREAQAAVACHGQLDAERRRLESDLLQARAADLPERRRAAEVARAEAEALLAEARTRATDGAEPDDDGALDEAVTRAGQVAAAAATRAEQLDQELAAARAIAAELQARWEATDRAYGELRTEASRQQGALQSLLGVHGQVADLEARQAALDADLATLADRVQVGAADLAALQPEQLGRDRTRLERVITQGTAAAAAAHDRLIGARGALASRGGQGLHARLAETRAERDRAALRHAALSERTEARALLARLFDEEMRQDDEALTRPLADRARAYLECLFGPGAHVEVTAQGGVPVMGALVRPRAGRFGFEALSVGTREQVGVAFRLALTELLKDSGHGCLPVVLDDAFANSDPDRVSALCRMLDLAAERGLQVIVLTCNPRDYQGLGAKENVLTPRPRSGATAGPAASETGAGTADPAEQLLSALRAAGGESGNLRLRRTLGWTEEAYAEVKAALVAAGRITTGGGRGGSVRLA
jgi:DNA repair exonuclease SbcCD ATPase subunit